MCFKIIHTPILHIFPIFFSSPHTSLLNLITHNQNTTPSPYHIHPSPNTHISLLYPSLCILHYSLTYPSPIPYTLTIYSHISHPHQPNQANTSTSFPHYNLPISPHISPTYPIYIPNPIHLTNQSHLSPYRSFIVLSISNPTQSYLTLPISL